MACQIGSSSGSLGTAQAVITRAVDAGHVAKTRASCTTTRPVPTAHIGSTTRSPACAAIAGTSFARCASRSGKYRPQRWAHGPLRAVVHTDSRSALGGCENIRIGSGEEHITGLPSRNRRPGRVAVIAFIPRTPMLMMFRVTHLRRKGSLAQCRSGRPAHTARSTCSRHSRNSECRCPPIATTHGTPRTSRPQRRSGAQRGTTPPARTR